MSAKILMEISNNYQQALLFHRESADVMRFLSLQGFQMLHEYQLCAESLEQRRVKQYITTTYHTYTADFIPESAEVAEPLLKGKNRRKLSANETTEILQAAFVKYRDWEESTLEKYQKCSAELLANGEVSAFNFVGDIIADVKQEVVYINDLIIAYNAMDWDLSQIVADQPDYAERYEKLIREALGESKLYHHHNSALDPNSKDSLLG